MKKLILFTFAVFLFTAGFAQSEKYMKTMKDKIGAVDTTWDVAKLKDLSAAFERIADAEKTQWQPFYYAALTQIQSAQAMTMSGKAKASEIDPLADKAEGLLNKAEALSKDNSEIYIVRKMIASTRMMVDPAARFMQYGPAATQALQTAKKLNPENPRVYLLEGQDKYFTPEQYGGSKTEAKKLFELAQKKFDAFKPATEVDPTWGRASMNYFNNLMASDKAGQ